MRIVAIVVIASLLSFGLGTRVRAQDVSSRDTLTFCTGQDVSTLNVIFTAAGLALSLSKFSQRGLLFYDANDNFTGELSTEVPTLSNNGISKDFKTITYKLRQNVFWQDGRPVTSKDVRFTWQTIMNPANQVISRYGYELLEDVQTPNDYTVALKFKQPFAPFRILFDAILPEHVLSGRPDINNDPFNQGPMGFGPYRPVQWVRGSHITYEANPRYFRGAPKLKRIFVKFVPSTEANVASIKAGDCDIAWGFGASNVPDLRSIQGVRVVKNDLPSSHRYAFNMMPGKIPLWSDIRVRRAIFHAIDRKTIIDKLLYGLVEPGTTEWGGTYWENRNLPQVPYDPKRAGELLEEAGWKLGPDGIRVRDGKRLSFTHTTYTGDQALADTQVLIQQMLKNVGVEMKINNRSLPLLFAPYKQGGIWSVGDYDMGGWFHGLRNPDPDLSFRFACWELPSDKNPTGAQWYHYCNPRVDERFKLQARAFDDGERKKYIDQIQQIIANDYVVIYLWKFAEFYAVRDNIENFAAHSWGNFYWNMWQWGRK